MQDSDYDKHVENVRQSIGWFPFRSTFALAIIAIFISLIFMFLFGL